MDIDIQCDFRDSDYCNYFFKDRACKEKLFTKIGENLFELNCKYCPYLPKYARDSFERRNRDAD